MQKIYLGKSATDDMAMIEGKRKIFSNENQDHIRLANKANTIEEDQYENELNLLSKSALLTKRPILSNPDTKQNSLILRKSKYQTEQLNSNSNNNIIQINSSQGLKFQWLKSGLRIITLVARFIYQLKIKTDKLKMKMMNLRIFNFIGDISSDFHEFCGISKQPLNSKNLLYISQNSFFNKNLQRIQLAINNYMPVIQPESTFKIILDSFVVLFIVINIFYIPMSLSFEIDKSNQTTQLIFETIPSYIFIIEILLNFNTAYYKHGIIHTKRKEIFKNYLQGSFVWDLLIAIPFILAQFDIPYIQFVLLLRVTRVRSMIQNVEDLLNVKESVQVIMELIKLVYFIIFVTHMCCCAWHLLGQIEVDIYNDDQSWLIHYDVYHSSWQERYIISMYWSVITTLTVGYGDIVPQTSIERIFVIFVAMIICGSFGYTISTIGQIMETLGQKEKEFKKQMRKKNLYIKEKQLNFQLSLKVRKYFEYQIQLQQKQNKMDEELISGLNDQLKHEVRIDIYKKILVTSQIIKKNFSNNIIDNLCQKVKQINYAPGDEIIQVNSQSNQLLFIVDGLINIFSKGLEGVHQKNDNNGKFFNQCGAGTVIGEQEFIMQSQHKYSYKAEQFTQIIYIEKQDFIEVLQKDEESYIKFIELKDKLIYSQKFVSVCQICNWTHHYLNCPFAFYQPNKWKILQEQRKSTPQQRLYYQERSKLAKFQTRSSQHIVLEKCVNFMFDNGFLTDDQLNEAMLSKLGMEFSQDNCVKQSQDDSSQQSSPLSVKQSQILIQNRNRKSQQKVRDSIFLKPLKNGQNLTKSNLPLIIDDEASIVNTNRNSQLILRNQLQNMSKDITNAFQNISKDINNADIAHQTQTECFESIAEIRDQESIQEAMDIDLAQTFTNYYPNFNLANVIESFNKHSQSTPQQKVNRTIMQEKLNKLKFKSQKAIQGQVSRSRDSKLSSLQDE